MPLINITLKPGFVLEGSVGFEATRRFIRKVYGRELPALIIANIVPLGLSPETPEAGVQVQHHDYDEDDVNVADVWVTMQLSGLEGDAETSTDTRDQFLLLATGLFVTHDMEPPLNLMTEVFWVPSQGAGTVNGEYIEW